MTGGIYKILLVSIVCFCMSSAFPIEDKEKGKSTEAPSIAVDQLAKGQDKEPRLEDQKPKDEALSAGSNISNDKQQQKEPLEKPSSEGDQQQPKPEKPQSEQSPQENKDSQKPSEQTTLSAAPASDHQKPDQNDQLAVPTEEKKEEQKGIELRHLPSENSPVGSFSGKDASPAAAKLEHGKNDKDDQLHQEKKIEEAILASTGLSEKKPEDKALPESTSASESKDDQKTTSEQQSITESSAKAEVADVQITGAPGASTGIAENQSENKPHHENQESAAGDLPKPESDQSAKETTEASQQQTTSGIQEQTSTAANNSNP